MASSFVAVVHVHKRTDTKYLIKSIQVISRENMKRNYFIIYTYIVDSPIRNQTQWQIQARDDLKMRNRICAEYV